MRIISLRGAFQGGVLAIGVVAGVMMTGQVASAGGYERSDNRGLDRLFSRHPKSNYYKYGPQVRGYRRRVGGYSYGRQDSRFFGVFPSIKFGVEPDYATEPSN